jgi:hypothetical protein
MSEKKLASNVGKTHLPPLYAKLVAAKAEYTGQSKSSIIADAVKKSFDSISPAERESLLKISNNRY